MMNAQSERIAEVEEVLAGEVAMVKVTHDAFQRTRAQLTRLDKRVRNRASGILIDTNMLVDEVMDIIQSSALEEDPEEEIPPSRPTVH